MISDTVEPRPPEREEYRALFLSDTHLYSRGCAYRDLHLFLKHKHFEYIYLVGDIVDLWQMKPRRLTLYAENLELTETEGGDGSEKAINIIRRILKRAQHDRTRIVYLPGNHDEFFRNFSNLEMFGVRIQNEIVHTTAEGKKLLVLHGDMCDAIVRTHRWLSVFGAAAYDWGLWLNRGLNALQTLAGMKPWSLARQIKTRVDGTVSMLNDFRAEMLFAARRWGTDGVVCGHTHMPCVEETGGLLYANCGDWVEHRTALVETLDGRLELINAEDSAKPPSSEPPQRKPGRNRLAHALAIRLL